MMPVAVIKHLYNSDESQGSSGEEENDGIFPQNNVVNEEWLSRSLRQWK